MLLSSGDVMYLMNCSENRGTYSALRHSGGCEEGASRKGQYREEKEAEIHDLASPTGNT
jgi:hypothetical protein